MAYRRKALELQQSVGSRIRELRKAAGLTQEELSEKIDIAPQYLSHLENGQRIPSLTTIVALAEVLDTTPSALLSEPHKNRDTKTDERISRVAAIFRALPENDALFLESELINWMSYIKKHLE